jgi:hypothetical protein
VSVPSSPKAARLASSAIEPLMRGHDPCGSHGEPSKSVARSVPTMRGASVSASAVPANDRFAGSASVTVAASRSRLPRAAAAKR